jgi:DNA-binding transcriptional regulator YhcF (GntR family)
MPGITTDQIFEAAIRIQLAEERALTLAFKPDEIRIRFPTTRRLADYLAIPHYYMLPYFAMMEQDGLVSRAERVGIMTTAKGTRKYLGIIRERFRQEAETILGPAILDEIMRRTGPEKTGPEREGPLPP